MCEIREESAFIEYVIWVKTEAKRIEEKNRNIMTIYPFPFATQNKIDHVCGL